MTCLPAAGYNGAEPLSTFQSAPAPPALQQSTSISPRDSPANARIAHELYVRTPTNTPQFDRTQNSNNDSPPLITPRPSQFAFLRQARFGEGASGSPIGRFVGGPTPTCVAAAGRLSFGCSLGVAQAANRDVVDGRAASNAAARAPAQAPALPAKPVPPVKLPRKPRASGEDSGEQATSSSVAAASGDSPVRVIRAPARASLPCTPSKETSSTAPLTNRTQNHQFPPSTTERSSFTPKLTLVLQGQV